MTKSNENYENDFLGHGGPIQQFPWAREYEATDLPDLGWITITEHGQENTYFTLADGSIGFVKLP